MHSLLCSHTVQNYKIWHDHCKVCNLLNTATIRLLEAITLRYTIRIEKVLHNYVLALAVFVGSFVTLGRLGDSDRACACIEFIWRRSVDERYPIYGRVAILLK